MLPLFPEGGGGSQRFPNAGCEQAWMIPAPVAALAAVLGRSRRWVRGRGGTGAPSWPPPCSGRAGLFLSLIYNVLDKCE